MGFNSAFKGLKQTDTHLNWIIKSYYCPLGCGFLQFAACMSRIEESGRHSDCSDRLRAGWFVVGIPSRTWDFSPPSLLFSASRRSFKGKAVGAWCWTLTSDLVPMVWMSGCVPPLPLYNFMAWTGTASLASVVVILPHICTIFALGTDFSTITMKAADFSEALVTICKTTRCHTAEDPNLNIHLREKLIHH